MDNRDYFLTCKTCGKLREYHEFKGSPGNVKTCIYCKKENQRKADERRRAEKKKLRDIMGF